MSTHLYQEKPGIQLPTFADMQDALQPEPASKKKGVAGFTLVEGLITAVIVAILAAVAVPMYFSYLSAQRLSAVESLTQSASVSANAIYRRGVTPTSEMVKSTLFLPNPTAYTILIEGQTVIVRDAAYTDIADTLSYR